MRRKEGLDKEDDEEGCDEPQEEAGKDLREGMLAQDHTAGSHYARKKDHHAKPPDGIEIEDKGKGEQSSRHAANGCRMGRDAPTNIDECTDDLDGKGSDDDAIDDMGHMGDQHQIIAEKIAKDRDDIGDDPSLLMAKLDGRPSRILTIGMEQKGGEEDGTEIDDEQHRELIPPRQHRQIAEREQRYQPHNRQIIGGEKQAHHPCGQQNILLVHSFLNLATGNPSCSRYLATVRRAIGIPLAPMALAKASSESGLCLSS